MTGPATPDCEMCPECEGYEGCDAAPGVEPDDEGLCSICHGTGYVTRSAQPGGAS